MKLIKVECPNCGATHWHPATFEGAIVRCLNCNPPAEYIVPREAIDEEWRELDILLEREGISK